MTSNDVPHLSEIQEFLKDYLGMQEIGADFEMFGSGGIDSMQVIELLVFLEEQFSVSIDAAAVTVEVLATPRKIAEFVAAIV